MNKTNLLTLYVLRRQVSDALRGEKFALNLASSSGKTRERGTNRTLFFTLQALLLLHYGLLRP